MTDRLSEMATIIAGSRAERRTPGALPDNCRPRDDAEGYAVHGVVHQALAGRSWGGLAGYKIGCTTPLMKERLSIDNPCGSILEATVHHSGVALACADYVKVGVETEIAVAVGDDLAPADAPFDGAAMANAVAACMAAMEIVDNRYADFRECGPPTLIDDDFFGAGCVLGPAVAGWRDLDLAAVAGRLVVNGDEIGPERRAQARISRADRQRGCPLQSSARR
ncbi:MAG: hydratase [Pseudomonadota bacterium]|nr:hydratase [Pseudomonadota bacterium]